jgi:hypothetical protein
VYQSQAFEVTSVAEKKVLNATTLANLDDLISAVREEPDFLRRHLEGKTDASGTPFVTADVVTCCVYLVAHVQDVATIAITGAQDAATGGGAIVESREETKRRLDFARNASLTDLLDIRRQLAGDRQHS